MERVGVARLAFWSLPGVLVRRRWGVMMLARLMNGVRPVELGVLLDADGPGSEKRTLFLIFRGV